MKAILISLLHFVARRIIKKFNPIVVGITGSVGKTSTKDAIFYVLSQKYKVRQSLGNYNTEIGMPLAILGLDSPGKSFFKWTLVLLKGFFIMFFEKKYPEMLILEMAADKPGDIEELLKIVVPNVGVITGIAPVHTEQFGSVSAIAKEKGKLFKAIDNEGWIVFNSDDSVVTKLAQQSDAKKISYGFKNQDQADIRASESAISYSNETATGIQGISFKIISKGSVTPVIRDGVIGNHQVYPALAAAAVAEIFGLHMVNVAEGLRRFKPVAGRMRVLHGIKNTILIDDTYNSSPEAAICAIESVGKIEHDSRLYAVFGDMLELGSISEKEHQRVGECIFENGFDFLIAVGERARDFARGAIKAGMSEDLVFHFKDTKEAGFFIQDRIKEGDVVLVKGSQGARMEKVVKEIMAEPEKAKDLLVRQYSPWI